MNRVYIVNLPEAIERRQQIYERCLANNIEPTFFKAIRGNLIDPNDMKKFFTPHFAKFGGNSTLGVAASHVALWHKVANNDHPCLILEDDAVFVDDFNDRCDQVIQELSDHMDFDILYLGCTNCTVADPFNRVRKAICRRASVKVTDHLTNPAEPLQTHAYVVSPKGARKLIHLAVTIKISDHVDQWIANNIEQLKALAVEPNLITQPTSVFQSDNVHSRYPIVFNYLLENCQDHNNISINYPLTVNKGVLFGVIPINFWTIILCALVVCSCKVIGVPATIKCIVFGSLIDAVYDLKTTMAMTILLLGITSMCKARA